MAATIEHDRIYTIISNCKLFSLTTDVDSAAFDSIIERLEVWEFSPGQKIINEGDAGDEVFFVFKGMVEFLSQGVFLGAKGEGGYFGEIAMFASCHRTCTVMAKHPTQLLVLHRSDFEELMTEYKQLFSDAVKTTFERYKNEAQKVVQPEIITRSRVKVARKSIVHQSTTSAIRSNDWNAMRGHQIVPQKSLQRLIPESLRASLASTTHKVRRESNVRRRGSGPIVTPVPPKSNAVSDLGAALTSSRANRNSLSLGSIHSSSMLRHGSFVSNDRLDWMYMARIHAQRQIFNSINTSKDGMRGMSEFTEYCHLHPDMLIKDENDSLIKVFHKIDTKGMGVFTEKQFCTALDDHKLKFNPDIADVLQQENLSAQQVKRKNFANVTLWYICLPVTLFLAPTHVKHNIIQSVMISSEIEAETKQYKILKNSWTAYQIKVHGNWDELSDPNQNIQDERDFIVEMAQVESRISLLHDQLQSVKKKASPGAFNALEFFVHSIPTCISRYVDETISSESPGMFSRVVVQFLITVFSTTVHVLPFLIVILYLWYAPVELQSYALGEVYMPLFLFILILLMQAGQDSNATESQMEDARRRFHLGLFNVRCSENKADTAEDIYNWIYFCAFQKYSLRAVLAAQHIVIERKDGHIP